MSKATFLYEPTPHDEAVKIITGKLPVRGQVFRGLLPELRSRAFAVAGIEAFDVLETIRDRVAELPAGGDWHSIKKELVRELSPHLVDPDADAEEREKQERAAERRAELLLRTHGFQAYQTASYEVMDRQRDVFTHWQYQSMGDHKVRATHAALDGIVLPNDSPFWNGHYPPWEWGCRCQVVPLMDVDVEDIREAEAGKPVDQRSIIEGAAAAELERSGRLVRGPNQTYDVRTPREREGDKAYHFHPADLRLKPEDLKERYSPETWTEFERWAKEAKIGGVREAGSAEDSSLWGWLNRTVQNAFYQPDPAAAPVRKAPVRDALDVRTRGPLKTVVGRALDAVDKVHDDGELPPIRLDGKTGGRNLGEFEHLTFGGATRIGVSNGGPWPHLTACHEMGHFLDYGAFGGNREFASETSPLFAAFRAAVDRSKAADALRAGPFNPSQKAYLLSYREQWARAYAQWIAQKSGDKMLLKERDAVRSATLAPERQWGEDDFGPIASAIEEIFKAKGWI